MPASILQSDWEPWNPKNLAQVCGQTGKGHTKLKSLFKPEVSMGILEGSNLSAALLQISFSFDILVAPGCDCMKMSVDSSWNS